MLFVIYLYIIVISISVYVILSKYYKYIVTLRKTSQEEKGERP